MTTHKRIKCITADRHDLGPRMTDSFLRVGVFYDVITERVPGPVSNSDDWIEVFNRQTGETFQRPRYLFGPILQDPQ